MEVARFWRTKTQRYQLVGEECPHCKTKIFPPRDVCPACEREAKVPFAFSGKGEVYSFSAVHTPPEGFEKYTPYVVALVRLDEGPLVTAQLTDVHERDVKVGMRVEMVTRVMREDGDRGMIVYGYKFRPALLEPRKIEAAAEARAHVFDGVPVAAR